jgi:hypothetical protein
VKGHEIRAIDLLVQLLPPTTPRDEIQCMAEAGKITDEGLYVIELYRKAGELPAQTFYVLPSNIQWVNGRLPGANRVSYGTSTPAAIHAEYLLEGRIATRGVIPCEGVSREVRLQYVDELVARGINVVRRSTTWVGAHSSPPSEPASATTASRSA